MSGLLTRLWLAEEGQDIAEYAVILAVVLVMVVGVTQLIGSHASEVFSRIANSIQGARE
jgi:Flp pilus assembly pilin Flp